MKEHLLVVIKPDGVVKGLVGPIISKFTVPSLSLVAAKVMTVSPRLAAEHYAQLKDKPFYQEAVDYLLGKYHRHKTVVAMVFLGEGAIKTCREIIGATNPEDADPTSIRGIYGRITTKGLYENVIHASSDPTEAEREIKLWFTPAEFEKPMFPVNDGPAKKAKMWT